MIYELGAAQTPLPLPAPMVTQAPNPPPHALAYLGQEVWPHEAEGPPPPPPPGVNVASRHPVDLIGDAAGLDTVIRSAADTNFFAYALRQSNMFMQEALLARAHETLLCYPGSLAVSAEHLEWFRSHGFGLPTATTVTHIHREALRAYLLGYDSPELRLLAWGAPAPEGRPLYAAVRDVMRSRWLEQDTLLNVPYEQAKAAYAEEWARASGAHGRRTIAGLRGQIRWCVKQALSRHPLRGFCPLDPQMLEWCRKIAGDDARRAYYLFAALSRCAVYERDGLLQWRSSWLRGASADERAIPGASTVGGWLKKMLDAHVFYRVRGHRAGVQAATYKLRFTILLGHMGLREASRSLGLGWNPTRMMPGKLT